MIRLGQLQSDVSGSHAAEGEECGAEDADQDTLGPIAGGDGLVEGGFQTGEDVEDGGREEGGGPVSRRVAEEEGGEGGEGGWERWRGP